MIYTITFNPALDYIVRLDHLTTGTINRTEQEYVLGGGKVSMYPSSSIT